MRLEFCSGVVDKVEPLVTMQTEKGRAGSLFNLALEWQDTCGNFHGSSRRINRAVDYCATSKGLDFGQFCVNV